MKINIYNYLYDSALKKTNTINSLDEVLSWIENIKKTTRVTIIKSKLVDNDYWFFDDKNGFITNNNSSFFKIAGIQNHNAHHPIIVQEEIGYLGIICKLINETLYFLMQAKIEPGNINLVQISPTIQATKSNFSRRHGGNQPAYIEYFLNASNYQIISDQIQSEQSSRFYKKRNRNIIILVEDDIEVLESHSWLTLGQIKELLKIENLVNMDTRTVISSIPYHKAKINFDQTMNKKIYNSLFNDNLLYISNLYHVINNYKMFDNSTPRFIPLNKLDHWDVTDYEIVSDKHEEFKVIFCNIEIDGREVKKWSQPLFEAIGKYTFGLLTTVKNEVMYFLVRLTPEIGAFDKIEIGPTIQLHSKSKMLKKDSVQTLFLEKIKNNLDVLHDVNLSEEGGRFYHEVNRNIIIEIKPVEIANLPMDYFWLDYKTMLNLMEFNNTLNIQLRNLISLLEF